MMKKTIKYRRIAIIIISALLMSSCGNMDYSDSEETVSEQQSSMEADTKITEEDSVTEGFGLTEIESATETENITESDSSATSEIPGDTEDSSTPTEPEEPVYTYMDLNKFMWAKSGLKVRTLPCTDGEVLGYLKKHEQVRITGQCVETGWYRILFNGQVGYASDRYMLSEEPEDNKTEITPEVQPPEEIMAEEIKAEDIPIPELDDRSPVIVIDAGHQRYANKEQEPIGPGATTTKKKVSGGTYGRFTGLKEYELNLIVAMKLKEELLARGYQVVMIRETHDINISNIERARVANNIQADAFVRIHANGSGNPADNGAFTICQTPENVYIGDRYVEYRKLADCILTGFRVATGCVTQEVMETDKMSGINWAQVPTTILEMGHMTNETEDRLMATEEYQNKMVQGIANGLDMFFAE